MSTSPPYPRQPLSLDTSRPPPFHDWSEHPKRWERLSAKLLDRDARFTGVDLFEVDGVRQYGIDAIGDCTNGSGSVVQSGKCYGRTTPAKIAKWSDEFLDNWTSHWSWRGVRHFVLSTAATNITSAVNRAQIDIEKARFALLGITFEVWGPEQTYDRLRRDEDLVNRFLGPAWSRTIFGPPASAEPSLLDGALLAALHQAHGVVSAQIETRLKPGREALRCGDLAAVDILLADVRAPGIWPLLTDMTKAGVLRLAASLALQRKDYDGAVVSAEAANGLHPAEPIIEAWLVHHNEGPAAALTRFGAPVTTKGRLLRVGFLLGVGDIETADAELTALNDEARDNAELYRLTALVRLIQGRGAEALTAAERADALAPRRIVTIQTLAITRYAIGLSPFAPRHYRTHPNPAPPELVRMDDLSVLRRMAALDAFSSLRVIAPDLGGTDLWRLACLSALADRADEATQLCAEILSRDPMCLEAAFFSMARSDGNNLSATRQGLIARMDAGQADRNDVHCLTLVLLEESEASEVVERLQAWEPGLSGDGAAEARRRSALLSGGPDPAAEDNPEEPDSEAMLVRKAHHFARQKDILQVTAMLPGLFAGSRPRAAALEVAELVASADHWSALAPYVDAIAAFDTADAVSLGAHVLHHTATARTVLHYIDDHLDAFPGRTPPLIVRRIKASALAEIQPIQALTLARSLVDETEAASDRRLLVSILLESGNVQGAVSPIRRLLSEDAVSQGDGVRYSVALTGEDRDLSRALWRNAHQKGVPDEFLLHAISQGYRLGLDAKLGDLLVRMAARAESGATDVRAVSMEDLIPEISRRREAINDVSAKLLSGVVPIHLIPRGLIGSLAEIYRLDGPGDRRTQQRVVPIRHGLRSAELMPPTPWAEWQVILDPTGLLMADQLDLLDSLESLERPVLISRRLQDALYGFEQDIVHSQRVRVEAGQAILAARNRGDLGISEAQLETECVRHDRTSDDVAPNGPTLATVRAVLHPLPHPTPEENEPAAPSAVRETVPARGSRLVFPDNTLETLACDGELDATLETFRCEVPQEVLARIAHEVEQAADGDHYARRLRQLRERIAMGLQTSRYAYLSSAQYAPEPVPPTADDDEDTTEDDDDKRVSPLEACLRDALIAPALGNGFVWFDDRYLTGYNQTNGNLIVGVVEVLNALVQAGRLTKDQRRLKLLKLRDGGALFIPLNTHEVLPELRGAPITDGRLVETPALATLRRNLASAVRLDHHLKLGDDAPEALKDRPDELWFIRSTLKIVERSLIGIWSDETASLDQRIAWSNWLWANLRVERCVRPLPIDEPGRGNDLLATMLIAGLLATAGTVILSRYELSKARQAEYVDWIFRVAITPRLGAPCAAYLDRVANQFRVLYGATFESPVGDLDEAVTQMLRHDQISMLPQPIKDRVLTDPAFAAAVGWSIHQISLGDLTFDGEVFWAAAARAFRTGRTQARTRDGVQVEFSRDDLDLVVKASPAMRVSVLFREVLVAKAADRPAAAAAYLDGLELDAASREQFKCRLGAATTVAAVARLMGKAHDAIIAHHYAETAQKLEDRDTTAADFLPPPAGRLLHALRLEPSAASITDRIGAAWIELETAHGPQEAFLRLGGLPVDLTACLAKPDALMAGSPIARSHLAASRRLAGGDPTTLVADLLDATPQAEQVLLLQLMQWSFQAFQGDDLWPTLGSAERLILIWTHAHRIRTILSDHDIDPASASGVFRSVQPEQRIPETIRGAPEVLLDCAGPAALRHTRLFHHMLAYVFGDTAPWDDLELEQQRGLAEQFMVAGDANLRLKPQLLFVTGPGAPNAMGSWLNREPNGLFGEDHSPSNARRVQIIKLLDDVENDPSDAEAWNVLASLSFGGLEPDQQTRFALSFAELDLSRLVPDAKTPPAPLSIIMAAGLRLGGQAATASRFAKFNRLAAHCAHTFRGKVSAHDRTADGGLTPAAATLVAVLELTLEVARGNGPDDALQGLHDAVMSLVNGWPAAAPTFRESFDYLFRQTDPNEGGSLWRTLVTLRTWP